MREHSEIEVEQGLVSKAWEHTDNHATCPSKESIYVADKHQYITGYYDALNWVLNGDADGLSDMLGEDAYAQCLRAVVGGLERRKSERRSGA